MNDLNVLSEEIMSSILAKEPAAVSKRSLERIRAQRVLQLEIEYIQSDEFESMYAAKMCLGRFEAVPPKHARSASSSSNMKDLVCLAPALSQPLLSFAEEQHEFRRMNFSKFAAVRLRESLNLSRPASGKLEQIERYLNEAKQARDHIVESNLRLVVSNAGKFCKTIYSFEDLVSDGTLALMEAVDKFDYQRGFRFSTYATHAIRRSFFRKIDRKTKDRQRFTVTDPDLMSETPDGLEVDYDAPAETQMMEHIVQSLAEHLTERERHIIEGRFGLNGRSEPQTLVQLSSELGICKERVRQVEGHALRKLHALALCYGQPLNDSPNPVYA